MSSNDRSTEFSLNPEEKASLEPNPDAMDWNAWAESGTPAVIPAIPFPPTQVFLPGESKELHLFEARYLALFENIVLQYDKRCAHVLIDSARKAMAAFTTIIAVKSWRRLDIGVCVEFEGVGRAKTAKMTSSSPYLTGQFRFFDDDPMTPVELKEAKNTEPKFWNTFRNVVDMSLKLGEDPMRQKLDIATPTIRATQGLPPTEKSPGLAGDNGIIVLSIDAKRELYEQKLKEAAKRAVNFEKLDFSDDADDEMCERRIRALSFAGWDYFPSEAQMRQKAIEECNSLARFTLVHSHLQEIAQRLAARTALQSVFEE